jgi:hypothetical protein
MTLKEFVLALAANFIAGGFIGLLLKGPTAYLISIGIGIVLIIAAQLLFYSRGLIIHYAGYGIGDEQYQDVRTILKGYIKNNKLNVPVDASTFHGDPYRGIRKHVWVQYSYRDRAIKEKIRHEGDRLMLP